MRIIATVILAFALFLQCFSQQSYSNPYDAIKTELSEKAKKGDVVAQKDLGLFEIQSGNYAEALSWLKKSAEKGNADAQLNLAVMYRDGEGCSVDYSQAMFWFKKAAENIYPRVDAYGEIGLMFQRGFGVSQDMALAKTWYEKGASKGDNWSMLLLGRLYRDSGDMDNALIWVRKSADAGSEEGAFAVYAILENKDFQTAIKYLKKSADAGYPDGMFWYGFNQMQGKGVQKNEKAGYDMIMNAAVKGSDVAMRFLSEYQK